MGLRTPLHFLRGGVCVKEKMADVIFFEKKLVLMQKMMYNRVW